MTHPTTNPMINARLLLTKHVIRKHNQKVLSCICSVSFLILFLFYAEVWMCNIWHEIQCSRERLCLFCGSQRDISSEGITPIVQFMKTRLDVRKGVNVEDAIIKKYRFTNVKRSLDPGSLYVYKELCSLKIHCM